MENKISCETIHQVHNGGHLSFWWSVREDGNGICGFMGLFPSTKNRRSQLKFLPVTKSDCINKIHTTSYDEESIVSRYEWLVWNSNEESIVRLNEWHVRNFIRREFRGEFPCAPKQEKIETRTQTATLDERKCTNHRIVDTPSPKKRGLNFGKSKIKPC